MMYLRCFRSLSLSLSSRNVSAALAGWQMDGSGRRTHPQGNVTTVGTTHFQNGVETIHPLVRHRRRTPPGLAVKTANATWGPKLPAKDDEAPGSRTRRDPKRQRKDPLDQLSALLGRKTLRRPPSLSEDHILSVISLRRARGAMLGESLFSEPAWDILLELYAAELGGRTMTLADLARAINTPSPVATRWQAALEDNGLTRSTVDPADPGCVRVRLTPEGSSKMEHLAHRWASAFVSI